jgi:hypothetical protein
MKLVDKHGQDAQIGRFYPTFRGEMYQLVGGREPQHASSTGRVWVKVAQDATTLEFFPGVFELKWVQ